MCAIPLREPTIRLVILSAYRGSSPILPPFAKTGSN